MMANGDRRNIILHPSLSQMIYSFSCSQLPHFYNFKSTHHEDVILNKVNHSMSRLCVCERERERERDLEYLIQTGNSALIFPPSKEQ